MEVKPNIVAILGPFLDQNNEAVKAGELLSGGSNETYLDYNQAFELMINLINEKLKALPVIFSFERYKTNFSPIEYKYIDSSIIE